MKQNLKYIFPVIGLLLAACGNNQKRSESTPSKDLIFAKGEKITSENFVGNVWLEDLVQADSLNQNAVGSVTFAPGARTKWHSHPGGQIIIALSGEGYYQEKGKPKVIIQKGEVIKCPPNVPHWHGASIDETFIQVVITSREHVPTRWLQTVTDKEYNAK